MHYRPYSSFSFTPVGHLRVNSPFGQLELTASTKGLVAVLPMCRNLPDRWATVVPDMSSADRYAIAQHLTQAKEELTAYFRGFLTRFTTPVDISHGTDFQQQVWRQLQQLDYGESCSYRQLLMPLVAQRLSGLWERPMVPTGWQSLCLVTGWWEKMANSPAMLSGWR